jgi:uncharacterized protein YqiB (DUF1249 family)
MLFNSYCSRIKTPDPRTFAGLMELYEANYIRLRRLCPGLDTITETSFSKTEGALDLHLRLIERCKYTTTIYLTYHFCDSLGELRPEPNLKVRVYHDARQAEVMSRSYRRLGREIRSRGLSPRGLELRRRWDLNRFLYKWLGYCCYQGHCFRHKHTGSG